MCKRIARRIYGKRRIIAAARETPLCQRTNEAAKWLNIGEKKEMDRELARRWGELGTGEQPARQVLRLHQNLRKAESLMLIQARTGKTGLAAFLFRMNVPGVLSPICQYGTSKEIIKHIILFCEKEAQRREELRNEGRLSFKWLTETPEGAR